MLVHLVDVSDGSGRESPVDDFKVIQAELAQLRPWPRREADDGGGVEGGCGESGEAEEAAAMAKRRKLPFYAISAVSGQGVDALKYAIAAEVKRAREAEREIEQEPASSF